MLLGLYWCFWLRWLSGWWPGIWQGEAHGRKYRVRMKACGMEILVMSFWDGWGLHRGGVRKENLKFRERPWLEMEIWVLSVCVSRRDHSGREMKSGKRWGLKTKPRGTLPIRHPWRLWLHGQARRNAGHRSWESRDTVSCQLCQCYREVGYDEGADVALGSTIASLERKALWSVAGVETVCRKSSLSGS